MPTRAPGDYLVTASSAGHQGHADFAVVGDEQSVIKIGLN